MTNVNAWDIVSTIAIEHSFPLQQPLLNETSIVFQYYSEMESGGHESLLRWQYDQMQAMGFMQYKETLLRVLRAIGADEYAAVEDTHLTRCFELYEALEANRLAEDVFYEAINAADAAYIACEDRLRDQLQHYAELNYEALRQVVE